MLGPADRNPNPENDPRDRCARESSQHTGPAGQPVTTPNADGELVLTRNGQRYVFKCSPGGEKELLDQLAAMAEDPTNELTWFDAAVLSHQMGLRMSRVIDKRRAC